MSTICGARVFVCVRVCARMRACMCACDFKDNIDERQRCGRVNTSRHEKAKKGNRQRGGEEERKRDLGK